MDEWEVLDEEQETKIHDLSTNIKPNYTSLGYDLSVKNYSLFLTHLRLEPKVFQAWNGRASSHKSEDRMFPNATGVQVCIQIINQQLHSYFSNEQWITIPPVHPCIDQLPSLYMEIPREWTQIKSAPLTLTSFNQIPQWEGLITLYYRITLPPITPTVVHNCMDPFPNMSPNITDTLPVTLENCQLVNGNTLPSELCEQIIDTLPITWTRTLLSAEEFLNT